MKKIRLVVLIVQRVLITAAVFFTAALLIHFTAIDPKERPISCDRACNRADWPRICRFELVVEKRTFHRDRLRKCERTTADNVSLTGGGLTHGVPTDSAVAYYTINGRYVGPTLTVCENDFLVVDVENRIPGESISLHWTGQSQRRTPFMDGVPMITQCPIASFTRFQYKFQADRAGTHLYHGFSGMERTHGLIGAFVVRSVDEPKHHPVESVWLVTELDGRLAVNGQRNWQLTLPSDERIRLRLLYTGGHCQRWLELEGHQFQVLALDGNPLEHSSSPLIDRILLHDGLRVDLTITKRVPVDGHGMKSDYEIRFTPTVDGGDGCVRETFRLRYDPSTATLSTGVDGDGGESIKYNSISSSPPLKEATRDLGATRALDLTLGGSGCENAARSPAGVLLCLEDFHTVPDRFPKDLRAYDTRLEFTIESRTFGGEGPFGEPTRELVHSVNGFTFAFPSMLMLREPANVELRAHTCGNGAGGHRPRLPRSCHPMMGRCECVHVEHIETGHRVEMVLINADPTTDYVYHLHGHHVYVVGMANGHGTDSRKVVRNLRWPLRRDTIVVRRDSIVILRFVAKNAGLWLLRDIGSPSWSRGLDVVLNVGTHRVDFDIPSNFPSCRHFVGPRYFLV